MKIPIIKRIQFNQERFRSELIPLVKSVKKVSKNIEKSYMVKSTKMMKTLEEYQWWDKRVLQRLRQL